MSDDVPDRPRTDGLLRALGVARTAKIGVAAGLLLAALVYAVRLFEVLGPVGGTRQYPVLGPEWWFLLLAFVLAATTAMLVTAALTVASIYRLARRL